MAHKNVRRLAIGGVVIATVGMSLTAYVAYATHTGSVAKISYLSGGNLMVANADGSGASVLASAGSSGSWAPDGSRFAYSTTGGIRSVRADGTGVATITSNAADSDPYWSAAGQRVYFSRNGQLIYAASAGIYAGVTDQTVEVPLGENSNPATVQDVDPTVSDANLVIFERQQGGSSALYAYDPSTPASPHLLVSNATEPDISPDGTKIAYVVPGGANPQVWIANSDGTSPAQLSDDNGGSWPSWSPDGAAILYTQGSGALVSITTDGTKTISHIADNGSRAAWQPVVKNFVDRVWGQDGTDTAIATSQWNYADFGSSDPIRVPAQAVVLSRSDTYLDALVGSALAIDKQAPLLITSHSGLELRVEAEIKRVLGTSGTVYVLGGPLALPSSVDTRLQALGYNPVRVFGATHYDTAIAIDGLITNSPKQVIVTTGANYYDALAAGAAAGANPGTVIVLTNGTSMPATSANYLNGINPDVVPMIAAGGPGNSALLNAYQGGQLPSWPDQLFYFPMVGQNEMDTALLLAKSFFAAPTVAAISTNRGWQDALTGGAMVGADGGPLLLTDPTALYGPLRDYLHQNSGALWDGVMLGGFLALPDALIAPIGDAISVPGQWEYNSYTPIAPSASGRALQAHSQSSGTKSAAKPSDNGKTGVEVSRLVPVPVSHH